MTLAAMDKGQELDRFSSHWITMGMILPVIILVVRVFANGAIRVPSSKYSC